MDEASSLIDAAFRFERAVTRIGNGRLRPWNMTLSSYTALRIIADQPQLTLAQLARRCYARPQTMTRIVTQLENRGFVARGSHPESERALPLKVTDAGPAALAEMGADLGTGMANTRIPRPGARKGRVKGVRIGVWDPSTALGSGHGRGFLLSTTRPIRHSRIPPTSFQEFAMADVAFVVTTLAVFALVAFVAKGVTKL